MTNKATARGQSARQANKERRRQKILDVARDIIATQGFDAFTVSELASRSGVTIPTVHNLFGKKHDIVLELFRELVSRIDQVLAQPDLVDPIAALETFIDNLLTLYSADEAFYRAAFLGGERRTDMTVSAILAFNATHTYEHYGNLSTYLRINGLVPPSSQ